VQFFVHPETHYVGVVYFFKKDGEEFFLMVKNKDLINNTINNKLPGGKSNADYEDNEVYKDSLFATLDKLNFDREKTWRPIFKNEKKRNSLYGQEEEKEHLLHISRTLVTECLEVLGYYPVDIAPTVVSVVEKGHHTQYFLEIKEFMDSSGEKVLVPNNLDAFKSLDLDVIETRIHTPVHNYRQLINSHKIPFEKFLLTSGRLTAADLNQDEDEDSE
jgi:hypothetical protein